MARFFLCLDMYTTKTHLVGQVGSCGNNDPSATRPSSELSTPDSHGREPDTGSGSDGNESVTLDHRGLLTIREVAGVLRVSQSTVRNAIRDGDLPAFRFGARGGSIRVSPAHLDDYIASRSTVKPAKIKTQHRPQATPFKSLDGEKLLAAWRRQGVLGDRPDGGNAPSSESRCDP